MKNLETKFSSWHVTYKRTGFDPLRMIPVWARTDEEARECARHVEGEGIIIVRVRNTVGT